MPKSAALIAKENGIGNVWGLPDEPLISTSYQSFQGVMTCQLTERHSLAARHRMGQFR